MQNVNLKEELERVIDKLLEELKKDPKGVYKQFGGYLPDVFYHAFDMTNRDIISFSYLVDILVDTLEEKALKDEDKSRALRKEYQLLFDLSTKSLAILEGLLERLLERHRNLMTWRLARKLKKVVKLMSEVRHSLTEIEDRIVYLVGFIPDFEREESTESTQNQAISQHT